MNPPDVWIKIGRCLVSTRTICGLVWRKDALYVLFPGQQYMQVYGEDGKRLWAALADLAIDLDSGETIPLPHESSARGNR